MQIRNLLLTTIALVVFASAYALIRIALTEVPPLTVAAIRFIVASGVMIPIAVMRSRASSFHVTKSDLPFFLGLGIVQIVIPNVLQNIGMEYTTASVSSVLQSTTPVFTLLFSFVLLKEQVAIRDVLGVIIGMSGVTLLSTGGDFSSFTGLVFLGNVLQVGVAASYAASGIVGKSLLKRFDPLFVVTTSFAVGAIVLTAFATGLERYTWPSHLSFTVTLALLLLSVLYCLALVSWYSVLQHSGIFRLYVLLFTMPVLAVVISVLVLGESFSLNDILFSGLTLIGVGLTQIGKPK